ncbi:trypsin-1-like [Chrysoperla carnea]|uniref:trypsin-1-like n=1 Tax=Chrysoperla carnea TaxID=189513 RepID=UPI001D098A49|nr:trypsin-1-like [Chrysoperla carnea]
MNSVFIFAFFALIYSTTGRFVVLPNKAQDSTIEEHPYQVSLGLVNTHYCSGTILSPDVILTTGHCADGFAEMSNYSFVRAGSTIKNRGGVIRGIKEVIIHEKYDYNFTLDHNVALILLNESLVMTPQIQPISLPDESEYLKENELAVFAGWWTTIFNPTPVNRTKILQQVEYSTMSQEECEKSYADDKLFNTISSRMFCVTKLNAKSACIGDSGGPLVVNGKVHGLAVVGYNCRNSKPGIATRVTAIREWIRSKVNL